MRRAVALLLILLTAALVGGCSGVGPLGGNIDASVGAETRPKVAATPAAEDGRESTVGVASSDTAEKGTGGAGPFGEEPLSEGGDGFEADTLLAVRHGSHEGFERVVLDLGAGEEPAVAVPRWTLDCPEGEGLLRVDLPSANATAVSDGGLGDGLLEDFHVVRAPEGGMFVDVLARKGFRYRVLELTEPARLVVDFRQEGAPPKEPPPAEGGNTVLLEPRQGAEISDPLTVSGYSRNFEAANTIVLKNDSGETLLRETVIANDWSTTWGYFEATLNLPRLPEKGTLSVGTESARDGSFEGVEIPVRGGG
ncbi:MAG TPA: Gmad2 immunoglobulin-like domain-containing protein [Rubrobacter sp.]|nr:Gmad2 immunoglobulin-like domain-containing protein [Rubrobacter sp.]